MQDRLIDAAEKRVSAAVEKRVPVADNGGKLYGRAVPRMRAAVENCRGVQHRVQIAPEKRPFAPFSALAGNV